MGTWCNDNLRKEGGIAIAELRSLEGRPREFKN